MAICVGCGLDINPVSGLLEVQLAPGGGLTCDANGLHATATSFPGISPNDCNALTNPNGLYVPCQDGVVGTSIIQTSPQGSGLPQQVVDGGNYGYLNDNAANSIHICNSTCCDISGIVTVNVGDVYLNGHPGFIGSAHLQVNINGGGFNDIEPSTRQTLSADSGNAQNMYLDINQHADLFLGPLASNTCADYQFNLQFNINTSPNANKSFIQTDSTGPKFVTRWVLVQTNCCDHVG